MLFIYVAILITTVIFHYYTTKDILLDIAYRGWGPQDYVNHKIYPENFKKDWPSGIAAYDNSVPMRGFYLLAKYEHSAQRAVAPASPGCDDKNQRQRALRQPLPAG